MDKTTKMLKSSKQLILLLLLLRPLGLLGHWQPPSKHTLWYTAPADVWMTSSLPIGNGRFGACVMGGVMRDEVQFNDKTLWSGSLNSVVDGKEYGYYLNYGNLYFSQIGDSSQVTNYRRWLDIERAIAGCEYLQDGILYDREYFVSYPDNVLVIRYTASRPAAINRNITLYNANGEQPSYMVDGNTATVFFKGEVERTGTINNESFYCMMAVIAEGGYLSKNDSEGIDIKDADAFTVFLLGSTNYSTDNDDYIYDAALLPTSVREIVGAAVIKGYERIKEDHIADYQALYGRCSLVLSYKNDENTIPTPQLITDYQENTSENLFLEELYFSYGRYLMISSSRGIDLPSNLQGVWNNSNKPDWHSDIHSNINVQMNYWPAEVTNLSELHLPFLNYVKRESCDRSQWRRNAIEIAGQTVGWCLTTNNNIYGSGNTWMKNYTISNAWFCMHLWQHYRYTLDEDYLRCTALPAMRSCCQYWMERLVLASDGTYECPNEYSPEHGPDSENATAHAQQLVWDLFNNTLKAYEVLNITDDSVFLQELKYKFDHLDNGVSMEVVEGEMLLREWKYTSQNEVPTYNKHRHLSHLIGLYPGNQIAEEINPEIYQAAINSLNARQYDDTGWSLGWKLNCYARAKDDGKCHQLLQTALKLQTNTANGLGGGIYENLWDAHPPFQIDGNFGVTAGIAEMLMQSRMGIVEILPALPTEWARGQVRGLKAVGGFEVSIDWMNSIPTTITIVSEKGKEISVKYCKIASSYMIIDEYGNRICPSKVTENVVEFPTAQGQCYHIIRNENTVNISTGYTAEGQNLYYDLRGIPIRDDNKRTLRITKGKKVVR